MVSLFFVSENTLGRNILKLHEQVFFNSALKNQYFKVHEGNEQTLR
jgi:hypothetical protein